MYNYEKEYNIYFDSDNLDLWWIVNLNRALNTNEFLKEICLTNILEIV